MISQVQIPEPPKNSKRLGSALKTEGIEPGLVAQTCNSNHSGGRDQEDLSSPTVEYVAQPLKSY
jgi:hypothetical protein